MKLKGDVVAGIPEADYFNKNNSYSGIVGQKPNQLKVIRQHLHRNAWTSPHRRLQRSSRP
jgi:hypothetical protein